MKKRTIRNTICVIALAVMFLSALGVDATTNEPLEPDAGVDAIDYSEVGAMEIEPFNPIEAYEAIGKSKAGIANYKRQVEKENELLASANIDKVCATITFSGPANFEEVIEYVDNYDVSIDQIQARGIAPDGTIITVFSRTDKGFEETEEILVEQAEQDGFELIGIIGMYAKVNTEELAALESDELTYLADTSANRVFEGDMSAQSETVRAYADEKSSRISFPHSIYWDLEELNIIDIDEYDNIESISEIAAKKRR